MLLLVTYKPYGQIESPFRVNVPAPGTSLGKSIEKRIGQIENKLDVFAENQGDWLVYNADGEMDELVEFFELYEKVKISYVNVFYRIPPNKEELAQMKQQVQVKMKELAALPQGAINIYVE